jgi:hypothetical protein
MHDGWVERPGSFSEHVGVPYVSHRASPRWEVFLQHSPEVVREQVARVGEQTLKQILEMVVAIISKANQKPGKKSTWLCEGRTNASSQDITCKSFFKLLLFEC